MEITHNRRVQTYHPHLHLITWSAGRYLARGIIRHLWRYFAHDPAIRMVDIRKANPLTIGKELIKYLTKLGKVQGSALKEITRALGGRRAIWTGGIAYGVKWSKHRREEEKIARITDDPVAREGQHVDRAWDLKRQKWVDTAWRVANADIPVKTAEQWANPPGIRENGEITFRKFAITAQERHMGHVRMTYRVPSVSWDENHEEKPALWIEKAQEAGRHERHLRHTADHEKDRLRLEKIQRYLWLLVGAWVSASQTPEFQENLMRAICLA